MQLSYESKPQIERKTGQIESRCCRLSYEADKLNSDKDKIKEKPCTDKKIVINNIIPYTINKSNTLGLTKPSRIAYRTENDNIGI